MAPTGDSDSRPLLSSNEGQSYASTISTTRPKSSSSQIDAEAAQNASCPADNTPLLPPTSSPTRPFLSWSSAYILITSRVIGSGIFATPGSIVRSAGSPGLSLLIWTVGAVIAGCGLAVYLEYGCMLPRSGGDKVYLEFVYRKPKYLATTLIAVQAVLLDFSSANCMVFSQYVLFAFDVEKASDFLLKTVASVLLTAIVFVHACFPRTGIVVQDVLGWVKIIVIGFMIFVALFVVVFHPSSSSSDRNGLQSLEGLWSDSDWSWGTIATSLFKVFYSYAGLSTVNNCLSEVKDPVRTLRSVASTALATAFLLYTLVNLAYFVVVPLDEIKESGELIAALFFERSFGSSLGRKILPAAVALSCAGNVMVTAYALSRLNQEIARQGFLPFSSLLASSKPFNTPIGGLMIHYVPSLLFIVLPPSKDVYAFILDVEGYPRQYLALALSVGLIWLRYKRPDLKRPFKAWTGAIVIMIAMCIALIVAPFFPPQKQTGGLWYATYAVVGIGM